MTVDSTDGWKVLENNPTADTVVNAKKTLKKTVRVSLQFELTIFVSRKLW